VTGPAAPGVPARTAWIAGVVLALAAAAAHAAANPGEVLHGLADESLLVPLARDAWNDALFRDDSWLRFAARVFSKPYSWLLGAVLGVLDHPVQAFRALALPFHAVFLAGCFRLVERVSGRGAAWTAAFGLAALPHILSWTTSGDVAWPLGAGAGLPRDLVFALLPWIWLARDAAIGRGSLFRRCVVGFVLGLLANVHPLTAVHAMVVFGVLDLTLTPRPRAIRDAVIVGIVSIHGAVPYLIQWGSFPRLPGAASREVLLWRVEGIGAWTPTLWAERIEIALWCVAAAAVLGRGRPDPARRPLRVAALAALLLCILAPVLGALVSGIQFDRMNRIAVWAAALLVACELPSALRARDVAALALAAGALATGIAGRLAVRSALEADRGPLEWAVRRLEVRLGIEGPHRPTLVPDRPRPADPSLDPVRAAAFLDVCAWVRANTPPGSTVLVPPEEFGAFRAYAVRPVPVTRKEGGFALSFLGGRGAAWFEQYRNAVVAYAGGGIAVADLAALRRARWAVLDTRISPPQGWTEAHAAGPYRVFRTDVQ
jgi:hypothetical protein